MDIDYELKEKNVFSISITREVRIVYFPLKWAIAQNFSFVFSRIIIPPFTIK